MRQPRHQAQATRRRPRRTSGAMRLTLVGLGAALVLTGCAGASTQPTEPAAPTPAPAPVAPTEPTGPDAPADDPVEVTRQRLLEAAERADWEALAALVPPDDFSASFGGETDPIAYYRSLDEDVPAIIVWLLSGPGTDTGPRTVWPELYLRSPFVIDEAERADLEAVYGADRIRDWEAAGDYLGWRLGIDADGVWRFLIAGD